jgi:hypothetical protein
VLLLGITWVVQLEHTAVITLPFETPSVSVHGAGEPSAATADGETVVTVKDLILILGGLFLLGKATWEIHHTLEGPAGAGRAAMSRRRPGSAWQPCFLGSWRSTSSSRSTPC